jgi:nitroreductase
MDAYLAVISKREVREYQDRPIPEEQLTRILEAGRATGSSRNTQRWLFVVLADRQRLDQLAETVSVPDNLRRAAAAVAIVTPSAAQGFDAGRAAQNMMIAAWADGVGTSPNSVMQRERGAEILGLSSDQHIQIVLSLGYPLRSRSVEGRDPQEILRRINRKPLSEIVRRL